MTPPSDALLARAPYVPAPITTPRPVPQAAPGLTRHPAAAPLRELLERVNARDLYRYVTAGALYAADYGAAARRVTSLDAVEKTVAQALFLGAPIEAASIPGPCRRAFARLESSGLLARRGSAVATISWTVAVAQRGYLVVGTPPSYPSAPRSASRAYLGEDSILLGEMVPPMIGRTMLDLGTGCGIHGLLGAAGASRAVLTEIDRDALDLARFNAALNAVTHPVEFRMGDAYSPVGDERFDVIVALAPYVPAVRGSSLASVYAGGRDGLDVLAPFIEGAAAHLEPGGEFVGIAQLLCDESGPLLAGRLRDLAPELEAHLTYDSWHPLQPYLVELATRLSSHGSTSARELVDQYLGSLRPLGITGVATARIRLRRPRVGERARHTAAAGMPAVIGRSLEITPHDVPEIAGGTSLLRDGHGPALTGGPTPRPVDLATADLLAAVDGVRTIAEVAATAWGPLLPAVERELVEQAIRRLRDLRDAGHLMLVSSAERAGD